MLDFAAKMNQLGRDQVPFLFILDFDCQAPKVIPLADIDPNQLTYSFPKRSNAPFVSFIAESPDFDFKPPKKSEFQLAFAKIQNELQAGNTYLTNLCFKMPIQSSWNLSTIFAQASAKYKMILRDQFVFFSPETFVTIQDGIIATFPMKGTIDATVPNAPQVLLDDAKEDAEHATIVDLMRNELNRVAKKVKLKRYKYLDRVKTNRGAIWQMSSEIQGVLPASYPASIGDIITSLMPAGSISGAPKKKTIEIIHDTENEKRGYYTGVAGIFDGKNLDSTVMIRFVEQQNGQLYYRSGGGITAQSNIQKEYDELLKKVYLPIRKMPLLIETIYLQSGVFRNLEAHQERMDRSRRDVFEARVPIDLAAYLEQELGAYDFGSQKMRCRVLYGQKIQQVEFIPYRIRPVHSLTLVAFPQIPSHQVAYKWADRAVYQDLVAQKGDADDVLIVCDGCVTDTSIANVAFWDGQAWWTPSHPLLKGTTRARLLKEQIIKERTIPEQDIKSYKKIRLFNAMISWEDKLELSVDAIV